MGGKTGPGEIRRRNTRQRRLVLDAVRACGNHPTAEDIYLHLRKLDDKISRGTVYRNLNLLEETGEIASVKTSGAHRFDWRTDGHAHVVCRSCGRVEDVHLYPDPSLDKTASAETGFAVCGHRILFEGLCPECASTTECNE